MQGSRVKASGKTEKKGDLYLSMENTCFTKKKLGMAILEGAGMLGIVSFFFYRSWIAFLVLSPYILFHIRKKKKKEEECYKDKLQKQFQDGILAVSSALNAGYSIENAFYEARRDLKLLYGEKEPIMCEFARIVRGLEANERIENLLNDFAGRSGLEDVENFAAVFATAKHWGGDFSVIIRATADRISGKMDVMREIKTIISAKSFENKIMKAIPFFIMSYIELTSPGFFQVMYGNLTGILIMTACLGVYMLSCFLSRKIMNIEV